MSVNSVFTLGYGNKALGILNNRQEVFNLLKQSRISSLKDAGSMRSFISQLEQLEVRQANAESSQTVNGFIERLKFLESVAPVGSIIGPLPNSYKANEVIRCFSTFVLENAIVNNNMLRQTPCLLDYIDGSGKAGSGWSINENQITWENMTYIRLLGCNDHGRFHNQDPPAALIPTNDIVTSFANRCAKRANDDFLSENIVQELVSKMVSQHPSLRQGKSDEMVFGVMMGLGQSVSFMMVHVFVNFSPVDIASLKIETYKEPVKKNAQTQNVLPLRDNIDVLDMLTMPKVPEGGYAQSAGGGKAQLDAAFNNGKENAANSNGLNNISPLMAGNPEGYVKILEYATRVGYASTGMGAEQSDNVVRNTSLALKYADNMYAAWVIAETSFHIESSALWTIVSFVHGNMYKDMVTRNTAMGVQRNYAAPSNVIFAINIQDIALSGTLESNYKGIALSASTYRWPNNVPLNFSGRGFLYDAALNAGNDRYALPINGQRISRNTNNNNVGNFGMPDRFLLKKEYQQQPTTGYRYGVAGDNSLYTPVGLNNGLVNQPQPQPVPTARFSNGGLNNQTFAAPSNTANVVPPGNYGNPFNGNGRPATARFSGNNTVPAGNYQAPLVFPGGPARAATKTDDFGPSSSLPFGRVNRQEREAALANDQNA